MFSHLSSSLQGLWTIRALRAQDRLEKAFDGHQDLHSEAWFLFLMTSRWFALRLDAICAVFVSFTAFGCILLRDGEKHHANIFSQDLFFFTHRIYVCVAQAWRLERWAWC